MLNHYPSFDYTKFCARTNHITVSLQYHYAAWRSFSNRLIVFCTFFFDSSRDQLSPTYTFLDNL